MTEAQFQAISKLLSQERATDAKTEFNKVAPENSVRFWLIKGQIAQKFQNWSEALNAYSKVLKLDNTNQTARNNSKVIRGILNFWNPEMFNP